MWHRRWFGLAAAWVAGLAGAAILFTVPDKFEASARVYVDTESLLRPLMSGLTVQRNVYQELSTLSRLLISRPNLEKLVRMTDLDLGARSAADSEQLIDRLARTLEIKTGGANNIYVISYRDSKPEQAQRVVQALLSIFLESRLGDKRKDADEAQRFIDEQLKTYAKQLDEAEDRIKQFRLKYLGVTGTGGSDGGYFGQAVQLKEEIAKAQMELSAAQQSRDALKRELAGEEPVLLPGPGTVGSSADRGAVPDIDARIDALEKSVDELLRKYTDEHPDVVNTKRLIAQLQQERRKVMESRQKPGSPAMGSADRNPVYQQLKVALAEAEANVAALRARAAAYQNRYAQLMSRQQLIPEVEAEYARLTRDHEVQRKNYDTLVARRESAVMSKELQGAEGVGQIRVVDPPRVDPIPIGPKRTVLLPLVLVAALGVGLFASFLISELFPVFFNSRKLRETTGLPVLGSVSLLPSPKVRAARRRQAALFATALIGLFACFAVGILFTMLKTPPV